MYCTITMRIYNLLKNYRIVENPREFKYMKIARYSLKLLGAWPGQYLGENSSKYEIFPCIIQIVGYIVCVYGTSMYLKKYTPLLSFYEIGHSYITLLMTCVCLTRLISLPFAKRYKDIIKSFVTEWHLYYYRNNSKFAKKTYVEVHKILYFFAIYFIIVICTGSILFNLLPIYKNYVNGKFDRDNQNNDTFILSVYCEFPFDMTTNIYGYIVISIWNWFATFGCTITFLMFDLILFILIFHVRGHFKILLYNIENFPKPDVIASCSNSKKDFLIEAQFYSDEEMTEISKRLKECIDYHRMIIKFTDDISKVFGPMLFFYYIFHQIVGCLLLLEISQMDTSSFIMYGPVTISLFQQLIQLSVIVESIATVTGKLKDAVYGIPWEYMDIKNRKILLIFLMNVQEPLHINALGLAKVGVTSMTTILKTSFSYFAFLRTIAE